ncbi:DNA-processing protein DprA [Microbacterium sp. VKM Ac-2923]|uniref:DNA-processing protein DprA n=1 Tax=Microbacterium sp. VKM Ac-2923 TaxID=2929476 RepID=UPI001FB55B3D|nr:DNA-processing protein DprA [Microbacterium sp. VKM Ac-2923]MCJ1706676.1 DNA-processing protein DprA [Microbacterium sp. VKM Ac-2923]
MIALDAAAATAALRGVRGAEARAAEDAYARAVWSVLVEPGDGTAGAFVAELGAAEALRHIADSTDPGVQRARARWMPRLQPGAVEAALDAARRCGATLVVPGDAAWPSRLDDLGVHAPIALWRRGAGADAERPAVALVGARASTAYGEGVAADLAADLAGAGVTVVSGAAYGIDGACHRAALSTGGTTVAFLAGGVDRPYPRGHEGLLAQIAATGAVWSETPCGSAPTKWRFLARNRLIAAMADAVVIVEAGWRSGSLNTAAHAATLGRALGAVPGPVTSAASAGCHRILREFDGACVTSSADVLEMIGEQGAPPPAGEQARTDATTRLLDALSPRTGRTSDDVARRSGLAPEEAAVLLGFAELEGRVLRDDDGAWRTVHRDAAEARRTG